MFSNSVKGQADKYRQQIPVVSVQLGLSWPNLCVRDGLVFYTIVDIECLLWDRRVRFWGERAGIAAEASVSRLVTG